MPSSFSAGAGQVGMWGSGPIGTEMREKHGKGGCSAAPTPTTCGRPRDVGDVTTRQGRNRRRIAWSTRPPSATVLAGAHNHVQGLRVREPGAAPNPGSPGADQLHFPPKGQPTPGSLTAHFTDGDQGKLWGDPDPVPNSRPRPALLAAPPEASSWSPTAPGCLLLSGLA